MHSSCFNCILFVPILSIEYSLINQRKEWYKVVQGDSFFIPQVEHHPLVLLHLLANTSLSAA